ncbi:hypothetical protein GOODEAATRI_029779 [Goodea atripinnis]|uniref:Uncharacterized protein n=1 Tax=Goodea atripinnis TaxID=208336 RepID=A0ABV0MLV4_9TELE
MLSESLSLKCKGTGRKEYKFSFGIDRGLCFDQASHSLRASEQPPWTDSSCEPRLTFLSSQVRERERANRTRTRGPNRSQESKKHLTQPVGDPFPSYVLFSGLAQHLAVLCLNFSSEFPKDRNLENPNHARKPWLPFRQGTF